METKSIRERALAWRAQDIDERTVQEVNNLLEAEDWAELADRFSGPLEFGTAGLRGILGAGPNRMNRAVVLRTTAGLARYLKKNVPDAARRGVVVGCDARRMSDEFVLDVASVLAAEGVVAWVFSSPVPTPLTAFATLKLQAAAGVMVTASHNPPEYNGYKVYWENGAQIIPPHDGGIAAEIEKVEPVCDVKTVSKAASQKLGLWRDLGTDMEEAYLQAIDGLRMFRKPSSLKIVYSAMHGVGGRFVDAAMRRAGLEIETVKEQHVPDGNFPTVRFPNPEEPGAMDLSVALAKQTHADVVLANDPDADRLAVWARGPQGLVPLSGNEVGVLLGHYVLTEKKTLPPKPLVMTTIVSSAQLGAMAKVLGVQYSETLTGFKWIANRALELESQENLQFQFGYEEALGYTVGTLVRDKDGIGAALVFADLAAFCLAQGQTVLQYLEHIQRRFGLFVSKQANFTFPGTQGALLISKIMEGFRSQIPRKIGNDPVVAVNDYRLSLRTENGQTEKLMLPSSNVISFELASGSRVTLRPSGTEPKIKYYFELKEVLENGEAVSVGRERAEAKLKALEKACLMLARERGQP